MRRSRHLMYRKVFGVGCISQQSEYITTVISREQGRDINEKFLVPTWRYSYNLAIHLTICPAG
jgi:hypothetical protein